MSKLKKIVNDKVAEIKNIVSDEKESSMVLSCIADIIEAFSSELLGVTKRQLALEERTDEIYNMLSNIEEELLQTMMEDFTGECPYCGEEIPFDLMPDDGEDFECPKCHNIIELEMMFDDCGCDCDDCHGGCHDDDDDDED